MACGTCGGSPAPMYFGFDVSGEPAVEADERGLFPIPGDPPDCEPYHGMYPGSTLFLACGGTDKAMLFLTTNLMAANDYAGQNKCGVQRVSVLSICHDAIVAIFGA